MPCTSNLAKNQTPAQRATQVDAALKRLESELKTGSVKLKIGATGAIVFDGWKDRDDVTDVCAFRTLSLKGSWTLRQAVVKAEAISGRKISQQAMAAGVHSHDGGVTWSKH